MGRLQDLSKLGIGIGCRSRRLVALFPTAIEPWSQFAAKEPPKKPPARGVDLAGKKRPDPEHFSAFDAALEPALQSHLSTCGPSEIEGFDSRRLLTRRDFAPAGWHP